MSYPKRLLGLFIGIDNYKYVTDLGGCVKDIKKVMNYFVDKLPAGMSSEIKTLFNEEATKKAMVSTFEEFLIDQATEDDVVLMYYSGHGAQEHADHVWRKVEADMGLEGLVCHDTGFKAGQATLLGDKEIRYLIAKLAKKGCDIITVFDACHSGDASRSQLKARRLTGALPKRKWNDFIFSHEISKDDVEEIGWNQLVPEGRHVQLAACEDKELAYENAYGGVFSHNLLKVLEDTGGHVSYFDLQSKIKYAIKGEAGGVTQTPQAHAAYGHEKEIFKNFLSRKSGASPSFGNISFNQARGAWFFDRGEIHGISKSTKQEDSLVAVPVAGEKMTYARIVATEVAFSKLEFLNPNAVKTSSTYSGFVKGLMQTEVKIAVGGDGATKNAVKEFFETKKESFRGVQMQIVEEEGLADYVIRGVEIEGRDGKNDHYVILTYPHDDRPLFVQVKGQYSEGVVETIFEGLEHVVKWEFVKQLRNEGGNALPDNLLEFEVKSQGESLGINQAHIELETSLSTDVDALSEKNLPIGPAIEVSIKNISSDPLYIACVYMGVYEAREYGGGSRVAHEFSLKPSILQPQVQFLEPGRTAYLAGGEAIPFGMNAHIWQFNWPFQKIGLKLIASRSSFDAQMYDQDGVKAPVYPWPDRSTNRGLKFTKAKGISDSQWQAWTHWISYKNPYYDPS